MGYTSRFFLYQLSHKAIERIVVAGSRHAGMNEFDVDILRFVASLDLWVGMSCVVPK
jgi:hypothetical protein